VAPAVILAGILGWVAVDHREPAAPSMPTSPTSVEASKVGDRVVFTIANGGRQHRIVKSDRPDRFEGDSGVEAANGSYVDRLDSGADVVFYRID
jgi:hypothetical protein